MLVFGHVATAGGAARWLDPKADLRWVVFYAILADLVDKPVGLVLFRESLNNGRIYFHSLLFNLVVTLVLVLWGRPLVYSLALWLHQLADLMWTRPWVALWPFTGAFAHRELSLSHWFTLTLGPYNLSTELAGMALLGWAVLHYGLTDKAAWVGFIRSGRLASRERVEKSDKRRCPLERKASCTGARRTLPASDSY